MLIVLKSDPAHASVPACAGNSPGCVRVCGCVGVAEVRRGQMPHTAEDHA